jgi:hypothetical protein
LQTGSIEALNGKNLEIDVSSGVTVNDIKVIAADISSDNGIVHVIEGVLVPQTVNTEDVLEGLISVYPNPVADYINVNISEEIKSARIFNNTGHSFGIREYANGNTKFDISFLSPGIYTLFLVTENDETLTASFIKSN